MAGIADILAARAPAQELLNDMEAAHDVTVQARDEVVASEARTLAAEGLVAAGAVYESVETYSALPASGVAGKLYLTRDTGAAFEWVSGAWLYRGSLSQRSASSRTAASQRPGGPGATLSVGGYGTTEWSVDEPAGPGVAQRLPGIAAAGGGTWLIQSREAGVIRPEWYATPAEMSDPAVSIGVLQLCVDRAAGTMQTVTLDPEQEYALTGGYNGASNGTLQFSDGVRLKSGMRVNLNGATLRMAPVTGGLYACLYSWDAEDIWVYGGGARIIGDRDTHTSGGGEYGYGLALFGGRNIHASDLWSEEMWGDGVVLGRAGGEPLRGWSLTGVYTRGGRRQGISLLGVEDGVILGGADYDAASVLGTAPGAGIDFEPDDDTHANKRIRVVGRQFSGNAKSIAMTVANEDIEITGCHGTDRTGIGVDGDVDGLTVTGGSFGATDHAICQEGDAALLILAQTPGDKRITIVGTTFRGGKTFSAICDVQADGGVGIAMSHSTVETLPGQTKNILWTAPASRLTDNTFTVPAGAVQPPELFPGRREARMVIDARRLGNTYRSLATGDATQAGITGAQEGRETLAGVTDGLGRTGAIDLPSPPAVQSSLTTASIGTGPGNATVVQVPGVPGQPPDIRQVRGSSLVGSEAAAVDWVAYAVPLGDATGAVVLTNRSSGAQTYTIYYVAP